MNPAPSTFSPADGLSATEEWFAPEFTSGLVSVIIPAYNRAELVAETIASLRAQTWKALEVIVVDDGSEDDTLRILKGIPSLGDGRTLLIMEQTNAGVSAARNRGTRGSTGEFIMYLDSDDTLVPDAIEDYVETIRRSGSDYCYSSIGVVDAQGCQQPDQGFWHSQPSVPGDMITNMWLVHAACYRRAAIILAGPWNEEMAGCEDHEFNMRIKWTSHGTHLPGIQGYYRIHSADQLHQQYGVGRNFAPDLIMLENFTAWLEQREVIPSAIRRMFAERYRFIAFRQGCIGDMETKNRALLNIDRLLAGSWSPRRLYVLGRWINFPGFYSGLAKLKGLAKG